MWHVSAAPLPGWPAERKFLRSRAMEALSGVGDEDQGEWDEWSGYAYHLKRRLKEEEQAMVGDACDIRNTDEAITRHAAVKQYLPAHMRNHIE